MSSALCPSCHTPPGCEHESWCSRGAAYSDPGEGFRCLSCGSCIPPYTKHLCDLPPQPQTQVGGTHYEEMTIQPWDAMKAWCTAEEFRGYLKCAAIKHIARAGKKGSAAEDIEKARDYLRKLSEALVEQA